MRMPAALSALCLIVHPAEAADKFASTYTRFELKTCQETQKPDQYTFEGSWRCQGIEGYDIFLSGADGRSFAGFGAEAGNNCSFLKTFDGLNTALSPVEWRYRGGVPIAAIERWSVTKDSEGNSATWLVVNALKNSGSCHMHYIAGSFPDANVAARRAADTKAEAFDCETGKPTYESEVGPPGITLEPCSALARE